ncbi:MAG: tetratricopeptide repeat protein, partial [Leptospirales bacterium]|nr:tetratricopeptide repeat protein [Leptospirales bacterium]
KDAYRSFRSQRYGEACVILEQVALSDPDDPYPYFLLAVVYLFYDKFDKSAAIIADINSKYPNYAPKVQLEAFLNMKGAPSFEAALAYYIGRIEEYPDDVMLKKSAALVRAVSDFETLQKEARLEDFVKIGSPPKNLGTVFTVKEARLAKKKKKRYTADFGRPSAKGSFKKIPAWAYICLIVFCLTSIVSVSVLKKYRGAEFSISPEDAKIIDEIELSGPSGSLMIPDGSAKTRERYASTENLITDFNKARHLLKSGEHNQALLIFNRILESNAAFMVKEKVDFLISFIINSDERKYDDISIDTLSKNVWLYKGYGVAWQGRVANLKMLDTGRSFTLLVGYSGRDVFSGTANIFYGYDKPDIENGDMVKLKGIFINMSETGTLFVRGRILEKLK